MTEYDAVVFDLDSTLCVADQDDRDIHDAIFERVGREQCFEPADLYAVDVTSLPDVESDREHYANLYGAAAEEAGADPDEGLLDALAEATLDVYDSTLVSFREGAHEALTDASERYAVGLLTNGTEDTQGTKLGRLGIEDAFDATVFCGAGTDYPSKPDPEPFEAVLDGLGVAPAKAVYVGDRLDGDVAGAHNAGMDSVWVPTGEAPPDPDPEPTYRLDSPAELPSVL
jgi:HAD superfamily hydrolase (TIGR01549 family)